MTTPSPTNAKAVVYAASHNDEMQPKLPFVRSTSIELPGEPIKLIVRSQYARPWPTP